MSTAYFSLVLDTTPPVLSIHAPSYVSPEETVTVIIQSNETLLQSQSIYIIDSIGTRVDLTFLFKTDHYIGSIDFSLLSSGKATLYVNLKDEVYNASTVSKIIDITNLSELFLTISEFVNQVIVSDSLTNFVNTVEITNKLTFKTKKANEITLTESTTEITLSEVGKF